MVDAFPPLDSAIAGSKWPNDLVAGERKVGGILPEAKVTAGSLEHLVLGIGVNLEMSEADFPGSLRATATSLVIEGGDPDPAGLLGRFLSRFRASYGPAYPEDLDRIVRRYRETCTTLGRRVRATTTDGETIDGIATAISPNGSLVVEREGREHEIAFGEVAHLS
jgi:BirA family biotin operon repressor/biotin-[acetyl-CoA-carboxylase] ligase